MPAPEASAWRFEALGTAWQIDTPAPLPASTVAAVTARVDLFDAAWSRFRDDSLVARIAERPGVWELPDEAAVLLGLYDELHALTGGAVTPLVGRALSDLGYDAGYRLTPTGAAPFVPDWGALTWDAPHLTTSEPVLLDVGAAGKGLLVDLVSAVLVSHGVPEHTVDASGDMLHRRPDAIRVALEHPADPTRALGVAVLDDGRALCGSATNRRTWGEGLHHVLDGRTGQPTDDVVATWVVADTCLLADGLATAHFVGDAASLTSRFDHEFVRVHGDGRVVWSTHFPGEVFA
jgi:thiamine biosynthesis lipoprotein